MANSTYGWTDDEKLRFYRQHGFWPNQAKFDASTLPGAPNTNTINTPYTQRLGSNTLGSGFSTMPKKRDFEGLFSFDPKRLIGAEIRPRVMQHLTGRNRYTGSLKFRLMTTYSIIL